MTVIVLHKLSGDPGRSKSLLLPGLEEKAACIAKRARLNQYNFRQPG
jgi:hypothetical protein